MDDGRVFGRTSLGAQEILQKSGRLTQTERLVLIVLGDQIRFDALAEKVSSLAAERVERALIRLVELNLAYEALLADTTTAPEATIPAGALREFLVQRESDPVTVMANTEQLDAAENARALKDAVGQVLGGGDVAVPLSKLFPERARAAEIALREESRAQMQSRLGALAQSIDATQVPDLKVAAPKHAARAKATPRPEPAMMVEAASNSSAGGVMMLIGGVGALIAVAVILLYALH